MTMHKKLADDDRVRVHVAPRRGRKPDDEFTDFVRANHAYLYRTALLLSGVPHLAEELVQATYERVYRSWATVRPETARAFARKVLVNHRVSAWRRGSREVLPGDELLPVPPFQDQTPAVLVRDELVRALQQLPRNERRVVVLRHLYDLPTAAVATELGIAEGTVKAATSRGLARLRDLLDATAARSIDTITVAPCDEEAVLAGSRAAARRRAVGRAAAVSAAVLLAVVLALGAAVVWPTSARVLPGGDVLRSWIGLDPLAEAGRSGTTDELPPGAIARCAPAEPAVVGPVDEWVFVTGGADLAGVVQVPEVPTGADRLAGACRLTGEDATVVHAPTSDPAGYSAAQAWGAFEETGAFWQVAWPGLVPDGPASKEAGFVRTEPGGASHLLYGEDVAPDQRTLIAATARRGVLAYAERDESDDVLGIATISADGGRKHVADSPGRFGRVWLTDDQVVWQDDKGAVRVAPLDGSGQPTVLAGRADAVATNAEEILTATLSGPDDPGTLTITSHRVDGTSTVVATLAIASPVQGDLGGVGCLAGSAETLVWCTGGETGQEGSDTGGGFTGSEAATGTATELYVMDRRTGSTTVLRGQADWAEAPVVVGRTVLVRSALIGGAAHVVRTAPDGTVRVTALSHPEESLLGLGDDGVQLTVPRP